MDDCARKFNTHIIGGDTDSHDELTMTGTALGVIRKKLFIQRSGAKTGDMVCVTGNLGTAGAAIISLNKNHPVDQNILKALFEPEPRINEGIALAATGAVSSMMDISDGLAMSLHDLSKASGVGFKIYENKLPVLPKSSIYLKAMSCLRRLFLRAGF